MKDRDVEKIDDFELEDNDGFIEDEFYESLFKKEGSTVEESNDDLPQVDLDELLGVTKKKTEEASEMPNNLLTCCAYIALVFATMLLGLLVFVDNCLCRLPIPFTEIEMSWLASFVFTTILVGATGLLSILFVKKQKRDVISLGITALLPFAILMTLVMYRNYRGIAICVFAISVIAILLMCLFYKKSENVRYFFRYVILWILALMVLVGIIVPEWVPPKFYESNRYEVKVDTGVGMVESNIDELKKLKPKTFNELSLEERLDVLSIVVKIESNYWALPDCPRLTAVDLPQDTNADYSYDENNIRIRRDLLKYGKAKNCLRTVLHEVYHAVQHQMVNAYETVDDQYKDMRFFNTYWVYKKEFEDYGEKGLDYAMQKVEIHADGYADTVAKDYYERIKKLTNNKSGVQE